MLCHLGCCNMSHLLILLQKPMIAPKKTIFESLFGVLFNSCPRCFDGPVFSGLLKMNPSCPKCQLKYEREPGYFLAAMSLSYSMGFVVVLPIFLILLPRELSLLYIV